VTSPRERPRIRNFLVCVFLAQMRVPSSPNQSANPSTPWEAEPVVEESGPVEDANAENLYLMGKFLLFVFSFVKMDNSS